MDKNYTIESKDEITVVRFFKEPSVEDALTAVDDIDENYSVELRLWVLNGGLNLSADELKRIAERGKAKFLVPSKLAIVASEDLSFGMTRVFNVHREDGVSDQRVFRTEQEALDWLKN